MAARPQKPPTRSPKLKTNKATTPPKKIVPNKAVILLVDDELHHVDFIVDYLEAKNYQLDFSADLNTALEKIDVGSYRALILDLNIPASPPLDTALENQGPLYVRYPGLFAAFTARTKGYRHRQVILYSVHRDVDVANEVERIGGTYIYKGRPRELKQELDDVLSFDPSTTA